MAHGAALVDDGCHHKPVQVLECVQVRKRLVQDNLSHGEAELLDGVLRKLVHAIPQRHCKCHDEFQGQDDVANKHHLITPLRSQVWVAERVRLRSHRSRSRMIPCLSRICPNNHRRRTR